jgi:iron complex outermembrane receptor protein
MSSFAQAKKKITGTVRDKDGNPIVSATINEKGTNNNAVSGASGAFAIEVNNGATLVVSSVGFGNEEIRIGSRDNTVAVELTSAAGALDEVVVTALGVKKEKRSVGYATSTVKGEDLLKAGATNNPFLALYGKAAGVGVNIGSSGPTGGVNVRIRGAAGMESNTNTRPLFVVDGVPLYDEKTNMENRGFDPLNSFDYGSGINDINPEDIESMEILKGAKATVLYGSQALNGVVLITTKSGKKTRGLGIQLSQQITVDKPFTFIDFQDQYGTGDNQRLTSADSTLLNGTRVRKFRSSRYSFGPKFDNSPIMFYDSTMTTYHAYPDNFLDFFRTTTNTRTNVAISGGGEFGSIRAAYSHNEYNDILPGFNQKENKFSFNGNFKVSPFATFEFINNLYSVKTKNRRPNINQLVSFGLNRDADYNWIKGFYHDQDGFRKDLDPFGLPPWARNLADILWDQNDNLNTDSKIHLVSSLRTTLQFTREFSFVGQASLDYTNTDYITENKIIRKVPCQRCTGIEVGIIRCLQ